MKITISFTHSNELFLPGHLENPMGFLINGKPTTSSSTTVYIPLARLSTLDSTPVPCLRQSVGLLPLHGGATLRGLKDKRSLACTLTVDTISLAFKVVCVKQHTL